MWVGKVKPPPTHNLFLLKFKGGFIMAIFKPINCMPYSNTFDVLKEVPYYFECEVDCSNI
jgi:hypothetical protein